MHMARKPFHATDRVAPTLTPQRGIELIQRQLQQFETVIRYVSYWKMRIG